MPRKKKAGTTSPAQEIRRYCLRNSVPKEIKAGENSSQWQHKDSMAESISDTSKTNVQTTGREGTETHQARGESGDDRILKALEGLEKRLESKMEKMKEDIVDEFEQKVARLSKKIDAM